MHYIQANDLLPYSSGEGAPNSEHTEQSCTNACTPTTNIDTELIALPIL